MSKRKLIDRPEEFLLLHRWTRHPRYPKEWVHPSEPLNRGPMRWTLREAVGIQLFNDRVELLERVGWSLPCGGSRGDLYEYGTGWLDKIDSPKGFMGQRRRVRLITATAFRRQRDHVGWSLKLKGPPLVDAFVEDGKAHMWCIYCGEWHVHPVTEQDSDGHYPARCSSPNSPCLATGYNLLIVFTVEPPPAKKPSAGSVKWWAARESKKHREALALTVAALKAKNRKRARGC
jgi:hypothetical protein